MRRKSVVRNQATKLFQSTHPTRECDMLTSTIVCLTRPFQSTHPTRECDPGVPAIARPPLAISIHAPYKRVRRGTVVIRSQIVFYFNPRTLQESATPGYFAKPVRQTDFNPRTLQESATIIESFDHRLGRIISIHAPYKRVRRGKY